MTRYVEMSFSCDTQRGNARCRNNHCNGYLRLFSAAVLIFFVQTEMPIRAAIRVKITVIFSEYVSMAKYLAIYLMQCCVGVFRVCAGKI